MCIWVHVPKSRNSTNDECEENPNQMMNGNGCQSSKSSIDPPNNFMNLACKFLIYRDTNKKQKKVALKIGVSYIDTETYEQPPKSLHSGTSVLVGTAICNKTTLSRQYAFSSRNFSKASIFCGIPLIISRRSTPSITCEQVSIQI